MFADIDEALDYLYSFIDYESDPTHLYNRMNYNIARTERLLELLGNPERALKIFHVAGTKGKGTVCYLLDNFLRRMDYKTGLFISPHIKKVNERISYCGRNISDQEIIDLLGIIKPRIDYMSSSERPTTFEILTALAVYYFRIKGAEYVVLETGMGGRLDSTNFALPVVSIITSISYDHMDKLGSTIEKIALEKAGIIKPGCPVVVAPQDYGCVPGIFRRVARKLKSDFYYVPDYLRFETVRCTERGTFLDLFMENKTVKDVFLALPGKHQINNGITSVLALRVAGFAVDESWIRDVFANAWLPGRIELLKGPGYRFILDSAHNESSARTLVGTVREYFNYRRIISVVGIVEGKDAFGILSNIAPFSDVIIITNPVSHKPTDPEGVWKRSLLFKEDAMLEIKLEEAIKRAQSLAKDGDIILITGSFYTVSPAIDLLTRKSSSLEL